MQDKYVGDIGDFGKYSLLNALSENMRLGVAWYKFPDESNNDGKHIDYLDQRQKWRHLDSDVFDGLKAIISSRKRSIASVQNSPFFNRHLFSGEILDLNASTYKQRQKQRQQWFDQVCNDLKDADVIFADPDNGILKSETFKPGRAKHGKSISEAEIKMLSGGRPMVVYHHNSRFKGGHEKEIEFWQKRLGPSTQAIRWRYYSARTYFLLNFDPELTAKARGWTERNWQRDKVQFIPNLET